MSLIYIVINAYALYKIQKYKERSLSKSVKFANFLLLGFILIDMAVLIYEFRLIYSVDYNQDFFMA